MMKNFEVPFSSTDIRKSKSRKMKYAGNVGSIAEMENAFFSAVAREAEVPLSEKRERDTWLQYLES
jgi:hypothetical protein